MRYLTAAVQALLCVTLATILLKPPARALPEEHQSCSQPGTAYVRTTLYFGMTHRAGVVTEEQWQTFLRDQVTPRFPDGLTVWTASGQWRRPNGTIGHEPAKVLLLVHEETPQGRAAVAAIINRYKEMFQQDSVLSETAPVCAQF
jgi:hypothetical protein